VAAFMALSRRVKEIAAEDARQRAASLARRANDEQRSQREKRFLAAWKAIYPGSEDRRRVEQSDIPGIAQRMKAIVGELQDRFWDFRFCERTLRPPPNYHYELAATFLAVACKGDASGLLDALNECAAMLRDVADAHDDFYSTLIIEDSRDGLPLTPAMSVPELARIVDESRAKVRGDYRADRWKSPDVEKYLHQRRWRHYAPEVQADVLRKIREVFPGKMWSNLKQ
jgi:hypothetical protein